jgi:hypothetical protein
MRFGIDDGGPTRIASGVSAASAASIAVTPTATGAPPSPDPDLGAVVAFADSRISSSSSRAYRENSTCFGI